MAIGVLRQNEAGAASVVLNHAAELRKRGHTVDCWFLEDVLVQPVRPRFEALAFARAASARIRRDAGKFDIVNLHAPWGCVYGISKRWFAKPGLPPYVVTMHGSEDRYVRAMRLEHKKKRAWNFGWRNRLWHFVYHRTLYDYAIKTADYGAAVNREAARYAEVEYRHKPGRIWFVPNGTEERFFVPRDFPEKSAINLLFVGTWLDRKGVYYLADAFALLAKKDEALRLTVAGSATPAERVKNFFPAELRDRVTVIPFVPRDEILQIYLAHDIFVFPSLVEGMPLTLLEAMATAMPVVTTNTCGMADVVKDGFNGLLAPPADVVGFANAVERLCVSSALQQQLGLTAQATMKQYTWERIVEKMEKVLALATGNPDKQLTGTGAGL